MDDPFSSIVLTQIRRLHFLSQTTDYFPSPVALQAVFSSSSSSSQNSSNDHKKAKVTYSPSARISRHIQDKETARLEELATARERGDSEVQGRSGFLGRLREGGVRGVLGRR